MKADELMVLDWVRIIDPDKYAGAKCRIESLDNREGMYYRVFIYDGSGYGCFRYEVFQDDIAPITLTSEILLNNGFEYESNIGYVLHDYSSGTIVIYDTFSKRLKVIKDLNIIYDSLEFADIHVHELQHIFRLLGIDKEINA